MLSAKSNDVLLSNNDDNEINSFLERYEAYILAQARRQVPRNMFPPEVIDLETDELVQKSRIKLWQTLQERTITNPRAYIKAVVHSEAVNATRSKHRSLLPLPVDVDGELPQGHSIGRLREDALDPATLFEQNELVTEQAARTAHDILMLSPNQQSAILCELKEVVDEVPPLLVQELSQRGVNIEAINWPRDKGEKQRIKASLAAARRTLLSLACRRVRQPMNSELVEHIPQNTTGNESATVQRHEISSSVSQNTSSEDLRNGKRPVKAEDVENTTELEVAHVNVLREPYRTAVQLHCVQKLTYPQVAAELNLPEGTVKSLVSRGMKMLQKCSGPEGTEHLEAKLAGEVESSEDFADVAAHAEELSEPYRTAIQLHYVQKRTYAQIASELHLPEGTVKSHISRGMKILRGQGVQTR